MSQVARERPRVLMLIGSVNNAGGAEVFATGLATHVPQDRYDVRFCTVRSTGGFLGESLAAAGVPSLELGRGGRWDLLGPFWRLYSYLRSERIDVLHAHMFGSNFWGTVVGRLARVPVIVAHEQTWSYEGQPLRKLLDGHVIGRFATKFIAVSSADRQRMIEIEGVKPEKTFMVPNAFVPREVQRGGDIREELGLGPATPLIGTAVVHRPQKAVPVMIDAFAHLCRSLPDVNLVIAGDGPCREEWEAYAARQGVADRTHFLGLRDDVAAVIEAVDVASLSSDFEGTPLFVLECMALGTPMAATDVGGLPDLIENGVSGLLVPRRDPVALGDAYARLLGDAVLRDRLADAARERVEEFSLGRITARITALYDELLGSR